MVEAVYRWIQNLACYFILLSVVMNLLPDNSYKKYIQYYMGLLLLLIMLSPIFQHTDIQERIDAYVDEFEEMGSDKEEWEERARSWEEDWIGQETIKGQEVVP